ncbi:hypothetical protein CJ739_270 [Mariniflexile rhizosphaerae]|nr:hypothetical protein CJ739_270 [Mariniflexile sp. TRM1-10]
MELLLNGLAFKDGDWKYLYMTGAEVEFVHFPNFLGNM